MYFLLLVILNLVKTSVLPLLFMAIMGGYLETLMLLRRAHEDWLFMFSTSFNNLEEKGIQDMMRLTQ
jgi:hypothetical protein